MNRVKISDFLKIASITFGAKTNLAVGSEQAGCLCGSAGQFDYGSNRLSALSFSGVRTDIWVRIGKQYIAKGSRRQG